MPEKKILIIHPYDRTTSFLDRIKNHLQSKFKSEVHYFSVKPNDESHKQCLERIRVHPSNGLIIFLGHGRSDKLYGSKADEYSLFASEDAAIEFPQKYYYNDNFINESNINVFNRKKVFCLACNSGEKVAQFAFEYGVSSFLGFGDIPTSEGEFKERGVSVSGEVVKMMKTELTYIIKTALAYSISKNSNFEDMLNIIRFIANQRIADVLVNQKHLKERNLLADYLYYLKKDAMVVGERNLNLIS